MQDAKEEVRARLAIEDVIGEYVELKRAGRNFKGLSPFGAEKTPSFFVSPDKAIWHDFSSGKGGDIFTFVMEVEGLDFRGALELLARKAGVDLSLYDSQSSRDTARRKKRLIEANELAAQYYQHSLVSNQHALEYVFRKRGLSKAIVTEFRIGYAPTSGTALVQFLARKGFSKKELADAGVTNRFGSDMFRGRMMVPLMDASGQVIGFTGRVIVDDPAAPKYLNTPQTLLYDKSRHVFGLSQAKEAIRQLGHAVIVEGNLDVVSSHQADVTQVVATAGTALTESHLKALSRLAPEVRLAFDADKAGLAATERAIPIAQMVGVELLIITIGDSAKDPDELIQQSVDKWRAAIEHAEPVVDWVLGQYSARSDLTTAAGKRVFTSAAFDVIRALHDPVEQEHYLMRVSEYTGSSLEVLRTKLTATPSNEPAPLKKVASSASVPEGADAYAYEDNLLSAALITPASHELFTGLDPTTLHGEQRQALLAYVAKHGGEAMTDTPAGLQKYDTYVKILLLRADARYADWNDQDRYFETARLIRQVVNEHKKQTRDQLISQLRDAEAVHDDVRAAELRLQLSVLIKEISSGKR